MSKLVRLMAGSLEHFLAEKILLNFISWSLQCMHVSFNVSQLEIYLKYKSYNTLWCKTSYHIFLFSVPSRSACLYFPTTQEICYHLKLPVYTVIVQFLDCNLLAWYQQRPSDTVNYGNLLYKMHAVQQIIK